MMRCRISQLVSHMNMLKQHMNYGILQLVMGFMNYIHTVGLKRIVEWIFLLYWEGMMGLSSYWGRVYLSKCLVKLLLIWLILRSIYEFSFSFSGVVRVKKLISFYML